MFISGFGMNTGSSLYQEADFLDRFQQHIPRYTFVLRTPLPLWGYANDVTLDLLYCVVAPVGSSCGIFLA